MDGCWTGLCTLRRGLLPTHKLRGRSRRSRGVVAGAAGALAAAALAGVVAAIIVTWLGRNGFLPGFDRRGVVAIPLGQSLGTDHWVLAAGADSVWVLRAG